MRPIISLLLAGAVLSACGGSDSSVEVAFTTVARPCHSNVTPAMGVVAQSQSEFNSVWASCYANASSPPQPPAIDFGAQQVIGFFLGSRPNGCYSMSITRISQAANQLIVQYREEVASGGGCTQSLVYPAHLVAVAKSDLEVEFVAE